MADIGRAFGEAPKGSQKPERKRLVGYDAQGFNVYAICECCGANSSIAWFYTETGMICNRCNGTKGV